jgi:carboxymethylenebutenolidase
VVGFYGGLSGERWGIRGPLVRVAELRGPLLGLFGGADQGIPVEQVEQFEQGLEEAGTEKEIVIYPGAPHSFFDRTFEEHAEACADAWRRVLGFLSDVGARVAG